jgi:hypothetical protein
MEFVGTIVVMALISAIAFVAGALTQKKNNIF